MNHLNLLYIIYLSNYDLGFINENMSNLDDLETLQFNLHKVKTFTERDTIKAMDEAKKALDKSKYHNVKMVSSNDNGYPKSLSLIKDRPPLLFYKGNLPTERQIAIVGSRKTSSLAKKITENIVAWITSDLDFGVVSGLALGIDTFAHQAAIERNKYTLAVLPNSLDTIYPKEHYGLAYEILEKGGCLISELSFGINRGKKAFVQRNRIQAALSDVVIPVEMGINSGTMHTINFAKKYKKDIYVLKPTPSLEPLESYTGINSLMKQSYQNLRIFSDKKSFINLFNQPKELKLDL
jgi:DNA processing protein